MGDRERVGAGCPDGGSGQRREHDGWLIHSLPTQRRTDVALAVVVVVVSRVCAARMLSCGRATDDRHSSLIQAWLTPLTA